MTVPKITAVMAVYNGAAFITRSVQSLLDQTEKDIEVLVVNDGSTDDTAKLLKGILDDRLRVLDQKQTGQAGALARACREARGRYIANMDADDISYPERLEKQAAFLDANPDYAWVGSGEEQEDDRRKERFKRVYPLTDRDIRRQAAKCLPYCHSAFMFRRSLIDEGLNYDPTQPYLIEFVFFQKIAMRHKVANLPDILVKRFVRGGSFYQSKFKTSRQNRRLAWLCAQAVSRFHLPLYFYAFPLARLFYPLMPNGLKRWVRNRQGLKEIHA